MASDDPARRGCVVLGAGVALLLTADVGSDGYSTLVNGVALALGVSFWVANALVGLVFVGIAAARRVVPGIGTTTQSRSWASPCRCSWT